MREPVAVVGHACVLPGATTPAELWQLSRSGGRAYGPASRSAWRLTGREDPGAIQARPQPPAVGAVTATPHAPAPDQLTQWVGRVTGEALAEAGLTGEPGGALVLGTLGYPTSEYLADCERAAFAGILAGREDRVHPAGGEPHAAAERTAADQGLDRGAVALDAACASGLIAVKLAMDALDRGDARHVVVVGANGADPLLVANAFHALGALSRSGHSRPLDKGADGLVPAQGAAAVVCMRLSDAIAEQREVLAVLRGAGLSCDGRDGGAWQPSRTGQLRALQAAWTDAGLDPASLDYLECHATGTPFGDAVEIESAAEFFAGCPDLRLGSLKASIGHPMAAAGVAALVKVIEAMRAGEVPPVAGIADPVAPESMRVPSRAEPWPGPRRAAISGFGFGGVNAHLIVDDQYTGDLPAPASAGDTPIVAEATSWLTGEQVVLELEGLAVTPRALARATHLGVRVFAGARRALRHATVPAERTGVIVGCRGEHEVVDYALRWRLPGMTAIDADPDELARFRDDCAPVFDSHAVEGTIPNMAANRVSVYCDLRGVGYTVFAAEPGRCAVALARGALARGDLDAVVVADEQGRVAVLRRAADASGDPVAAGADLTGLVYPRTDVSVDVVRATDAEAALRALAGEQVPAGDHAIGMVGVSRDEARQALGKPGAPLPAGLAVADRPVRGGVVLTYTNGSAAYRGMGRQLVDAYPGLGRPPRDWQDPIGQIHATVDLAGLHTRITRSVLKIEAHHALGHCSGEVAAAAALGAWREPEEVLRGQRASRLFSSGLTGTHTVLSQAWGRPARWASAAVQAEPEQVSRYLGPESHVMTHNAPGATVVGGPAEKLFGELDRSGLTYQALDYDLVAHVPELAGIPRRPGGRPHRTHPSGAGHRIRFRRRACLGGVAVRPGTWPGDRRADRQSARLATDGVRTRRPWRPAVHRTWPQELLHELGGRHAGRTRAPRRVLRPGP